jgi:hypothetical protein
MSHSLFISDSYIKTTCPVYDNVDAKDLVSHIVCAQDTDLQLILGSKLYKALQTAVAASATSTVQNTLLTYIQPYLAWMSYWYAMPFLHMKTTNKSMIVKGSEHSTAVTVKDMQTLRAEVRNRAEFYSTRLQEYLRYNAPSFAEYTNPDNPLSPNYAGTAYFSGMYLGRPKPQNTGPNFDFDSEKNFNQDNNY